MWPAKRLLGQLGADWQRAVQGLVGVRGPGRSEQTGHDSTLYSLFTPD